MLDSVRQDLRYAFRTLTRAPGFTAIVVLTLAFGIAANTIVFSFINPYFFRALPFGDADRLVQVGQVDPVAGWDGGRFSLPMYRDYLEGNASFDDLGIYRYTYRNFTGSGDPERVFVGVMSANMFSILRAQPALGRTFVAGEDGPAGSDVVVLGSGLWNRRFGGEASAVGQTMMLDEIPHVIVGVMPPRFNFPFGEIELWVPDRGDPLTTARDATSNIVVGRLRDGATADRARDELSVIQQRLGEQYPEADGSFAGISVKPMREALNFAYDVLRIMSVLLLAAVGFALLVACVNVASLTLARATSRTGEVALRTALGAGKRRIVRQFLTENLVLAVVGGTLGIALAVAVTTVAGGVLPEGLYKVGDASIDGTVLGFALFVTLLTPIFFGLAPALGAARADINSALKEGGRAGRGLASMRARQGLVVFEIAMALVLVSGMGLMIRSFISIQNVDLGFEADRILVAEVSPPASAYGSADQLEDYYGRATAAIEGVIGVRQSGHTAVLPLNHESGGSQFARPGREPVAAADWPRALQYQVSPDYFDAMRIPILSGRPFDQREGRDAPFAVILSQSLAEAHWPGESAIGQTLLYGDPDDPRQATIVGVAGDVKHDGIHTPVQPSIYRAITQVTSRRRFITVATAAEPMSLVPAVRQALYAVDPNLPVTLRPMTEVVRESTLMWSVTSLVLTVLGLASLLLASLGIYGVISYSVAQRRREIGVRMALGATGHTIRGTFLGEGVRLGLVGVGVGVVLALGTGRLLNAVLFGVSPFDLVSNGGAVVLFVGVAVLASLIPALRASRVDPQGALRAE